MLRSLTGCFPLGHSEAVRTCGKAFSPWVVVEAGRGSSLVDVALVDVVFGFGFVAFAVVLVTLEGWI